MNTVVINEVVGTAWVRNADGSLTQIRQGMRVSENAEIITENDARVVVAANDGPMLTIGENREFLLSADIFNTEVDALAASMTAFQATDLDSQVAQVLAALESGVDPFEVLDPTAAVLSAAGDGAGGSSFTRLASILETTIPLALEYPRPSVDRPDAQIFGATVPAGTTDNTIIGGAEPETPVVPEPVEPEVPVEPETPVAPEPEVPVDPGTPVDPEEPVFPEFPVDPEEPVEPEFPVDPEEPVDPEVPVDPQEPEVPMPAPVNIDINDVIISEGQEAEFTVTLSRQLDRTSKMTFTINPGTAGFDDLWEGGIAEEGVEIIVMVGGVEQTVTVNPDGTFSVDIPRGVTEVTVKLPTFNDDVFEGEEGFKLNVSLTNTGTNHPSTEGNGLIVDDGRELPPVNPVDPDEPVDPENPVEPEDSIYADDDRPTVSINDITVSEGDEAVFDVKLTNPVKLPTTLTFTLKEGSAEFTDLWETGEGTVTVIIDGKEQTVSVKDDGTFTIEVPALTTEVQIKVPTFDDNVFENDEQFTLGVELSGKGFENSTDTGTGTIVDDGRDLPIDPTQPEGPDNPGNPDTPANDDRPTVSITDIIVSEGDEAVFNVKLTNPVKEPTTLTFTLKEGSAEFTDLWEKGEGTVTVIIDGKEQTVTVQADGTFTVEVPTLTTDVQVKVPTFNDNVFENDEQFTLDVELSGQGFENSTDTGTGTIVDDGRDLPIDPTEPEDEVENPGNPDTPANDDRPTVSITDIIVSEGEEAVFNVKLTNPVKEPTTLTFTLKEGSAEFTDLWETGEGTVTVSVDGKEQTVKVQADGTFTVEVPALTTEVQVKVPTFNDEVFEGDEQFTLEVELSGDGFESSQDIGTGTIVDDGRNLPIDPTQPEGPGNEEDPKNPANDDKPQLIIGNAETTEGGWLNFDVSLTKEVGFDSTVTLTIQPDSALAEDLWKSETKTVNVKSGNVTTEVTVAADGKGGFTFEVNVPKGEQNFTVSVPSVDDSIIEDTEIFNLDGLWSGSAVGKDYSVQAEKPGVGTILDNDKTELNVSDVTVNEGDVAEFEITLKGGELPVDTDLSLKLNPGTAGFDDLWADGEERKVQVKVGDDEPKDFWVNDEGYIVDKDGKPVTVPSGETKITVFVPTNQDDVLEFEEKFTLDATLTGNVGDREIELKDSGTGAILDDGTGPVDPTDPKDPDDDRPELTVTGGGVVKEGDPAKFDVKLTNPTKDDYVLEFDFQPKKDGNSASIDDLTDKTFTVSYTDKDGNTVVTTITGGKGEIKIPGGVTDIKVSMPTILDGKFEGSEGFDLVVTDKSGVTTNGSDSADAFIVDAATDNVIEAGVGKEADGSKSTDANKDYKGDLEAKGNVFAGSTAVVISGVKDHEGNDVEGNGPWTFETEYGNITINADGSYTYTLDHGKTDGLNVNDTPSETFTYTVKAEDDSTVEQTLTINITGTNDAPIISTKVNKGDVIEDDQSTATGQLKADDVDHAQAELTWSLADSDTPVESITGIYGTLTLNKDTGGWEYTVNHDLVQHLGEGETASESFPVWVKDALGASDQTNIDIVITGTNDAPIAQDQNNTVVESGVAKGGNTDFEGTPTATGDLLAGATDADETAELSLKSVNGKPFADGKPIEITNEYGTLTVNADGTYTYELNNESEAVNKLALDQAHKETFTFTITDENGGISNKELTITIKGTNDKPEITSAGQTGSVTEAGHGEDGDVVVGKLETSGQLTAEDIDTGAKLTWTFEDGSNRIETEYGYVTLDAETGEWAYTLENDKPATQALKEGQEVPQDFNVVVKDEHGAFDTSEIKVTITGTNDAPVMGNTDTLEKTILETESVSGNLIKDTDTTDVDSDLGVKGFTVADKDYSFAPGVDSIMVGPEQGLTEGTLTIFADGNYTFQPRENNFSGKVPTIDFTIAEKNSDGTFGLEKSSKLEITVTPVADTPELKGEDGKTNEDVSIRLNLTAPKVTDNEDYSPGVDGDYPERLSEITVSGFKAGDKITISDGREIEIGANGALAFVISDLDAEKNGSHLDGLQHKDDVIVLTQEQYENLLFTPKEHDGYNRDLTISVSSNEIDKDGKILDTATNTQKITVDIVAVTDEVILTFDPDKTGEIDITVKPETGKTTEVKGTATITASDKEMSLSVTTVEDSSINLKDLLKAAFEDLDGSEERWVTIKNTSSESIWINGKEVKSGATSGKIAQGTLSKDTDGFGDIWVKGAKDFSGNFNGKLEINLHGKDRDYDSNDGTANKPSRGEEVKDTVTLDLALTVTPVVDGIHLGNEKTKEDTSVLFLSSLALKDKDGSETLDSFKLKLSSLPVGSVIKDNKGDVVLRYDFDQKRWEDGEGKAVTDEYVELLPSADQGGIDALKELTITPPAHSSKDFNLEFTSTVTDTGAGQTVTTTTDHKQSVTVTPVAEEIGQGKIGDTDGDGVNDLTMNEDHRYDSSTTEDNWFALNVEDGFNLKDGWTNQDGDKYAGGSEKTYAFLTPQVGKGGLAAGDTFNPAEAHFRYKCEDGGWIYPKYETINGVGGFKIPVEFLDSVEFMAPKDVAGEFKIEVRAYTEDFGENSDGAPDWGNKNPSTALSGLATLDGITVKAVADGVSALETRKASGLEDKPIDLVINPKSQDPSETFDVKLGGNIPTGAEFTYGDSTAVRNDNGTYTISNKEGGDTPFALDKDGQLIIKDFDSSTKLTVQAPTDSNNNFEIEVSARSKDSFGGETSTSGWSKEQKVHVTVKGVADGAELTVTGKELAENAVDNAGNKIALKDMGITVDLKDTDGSESAALQITGLPEGFTVEGATLLSGKGEDRVWIVSKDQFDNVSIIVPEHFSGKLPGSIAAVTTENDGDQNVGTSVDFNVTVKAGLDGKLSGGSNTILEDDGGRVDFASGFSSADGKESLTGVYLSVTDVARLKGEGLELFVDGKPIGGLDPENGYYHITDVDSVTAKAGANIAHQGDNFDSLSFEFEDIKYDVTQTDNDGNGSTIFEVKGGDYSITVTPVTDDPSLEAGKEGDLTDTTQKISLKVKTGDSDSSESLVEVRISGIPDGVILEPFMLDGKEVTPVMLAAGVWGIFIPKDVAANLKEGELNLDLTLKADAGVGKVDTDLTVTVYTQDKGAANIENATQTFPLDVNFGGTGGGSGTNLEVTVTPKDPIGVLEDKTFTLDDVISAKITGNLDANFSIVVKLPKGSKLEGIDDNLVTSYQDGEGNTVWILSGKGQDKLDQLLKDVTVTPPKDWNTVKNGGDFPIDITVNGFEDTGRTDSSGSIKPEVDVKPVTDAPDVSVKFTDGAGGTPKEGENIQVKISVGNSKDAPLTVTDGKVIITVNGKGELYDAEGNLLKPNADDKYELPVDSIPTGGVFDSILTYKPHEDEKNGDFKLEVTVGGEVLEDGATEPADLTGDGSTTVEKINNGYEISDITAESNEIGTTDDKNELAKEAIKLNISGTGLKDKSEIVSSAVIKGLPDDEGFLVYYKDAAGVTQLALNAGGGNWLVPSVGDDIPEVFVLPPQHWSGELGLTLEVQSGEVGREPHTDSHNFTLKATPVADGIYELAPDTSYGVENELIHLNLNVSLVDSEKASASDQSVEKATVVFTGLGEFAAFFIDGEFIEATYADGKYTIDGLTQEQINKLQISQASGADRTVNIEVYTQEYDVKTGKPESDKSDSVTKDFTLSISAQQTTSDADTLMYSGSAIAGLASNDTVFLRPGDNLNFATAAAHLAGVGTIDLASVQGYAANTLSGLSVDAMKTMFGSNGGELTINANKGDRIAFSDAEWTQSETTGVYVSKDGEYTVKIAGNEAEITGQFVMQDDLTANSLIDLIPDSDWFTEEIEQTEVVETTSSDEIKVEETILGLVTEVDDAEDTILGVEIESEDVTDNILDAEKDFDESEDSTSAYQDDSETLRLDLLSVLDEGTDTELDLGDNSIENIPEKIAVVHQVEIHNTPLVNENDKLGDGVNTF